MPFLTKIQALVVVAVFAAVFGFNQTGYFVPGESPTVTLSYNSEGTPSAPIVITEDLPTKLKPRWDVHLSGDDDQLG